MTTILDRNLLVGNPLNRIDDIDERLERLERTAITDTNLLVTATMANMTIGFVVPGTLAVGSGVIRMHAPRDGTITNVTATVNTAPTGASIIVDINVNGSSIFLTTANRPTIAASAQNDLSSLPDIVDFFQDDVFTMDIDQVGSTVAGADLVVQVRYDG